MITITTLSETQKLKASAFNTMIARRIQKFGEPSKKQLYYFAYLFGQENSELFWWLYAKCAEEMIRDCY